MEKDYIRMPILQTIRKSPFIGLQKHFKYVKSGTLALERSVKYYLDGNFKSFKKNIEKVYKYETQADRVKGNIRNHLPKFIFLPIDKRDFLILLSESEGILEKNRRIASVIITGVSFYNSLKKNKWLGEGCKPPCGSKHDLARIENFLGFVGQ